jgi:hypothetical protein
MACHGCGSDWLSHKGNDCVTCPWCCKLKRCQERKRRRWDRPKGEPFRPSVHKKKTNRAKRKADRCHHCGKALSARQIKYCNSACFFAARKAGTQGWDRTKQTEGCYHRGGRWNNSISKKYVERVFGLDRWLSEASSLWKRMWELHKTQRRCEVCGDSCKGRASRFCSFECNKAWRGDRQCPCGKAVIDATAFGPPPSCDDCKRESRRLCRRMYGCYRRRCRTYGGHYNSAVKPRSVFERDRWRCHVCGKKTHRDFSVHDPRSATVDHHPIPLSKGGDHDWHNVRCCCFKCNSLKGAKWDGQQRIAFA